MKTGQYIGHAVLYFFRWVLIVALIYAILFLTNTAKVSTGYYIQDLFTSMRGVWMLVVLGVIAAIYPAFGFVSRRVEADIRRDDADIINAFVSDGYTMRGNEPGQRMTFRASSPMRKIFMMFDDKVTVSADGDGAVIIEGNRKAVVNAQFRIASYIRNSRGDE